MKILIVDDEEIVTKMICKYLIAKNHDCIELNNGKDALNKIREERFDIILLDLAMSEFSGYDVLKELKKEDVLKKQKILLFTALPVSIDDVEKTINYKEGIYGVVKKPVEFDVLLKKIESVIKTP